LGFESQIYKSMQHLLPFQVYESKTTSVLTLDQEAFLNRYTQGTWSVNPETGLVDVSGNFDCSERGFKSLKGVSFGHVSGNFKCYNNRLTSLAGAPQTVGGYFSCYNNRLTTLEGAPQTVGEWFQCNDNLLTTLAGAPQTLGGHFYCYNNRLTSLAGAPQTVDGYFSCASNLLTSLVGAPQTVGGSFYCENNQLTTLEGAPQTVDGDFSCGRNQLTSLVGAPQTVGGHFSCVYNRLTTLEGAPQTVDGVFSCDAFRLKQGEWNPSGWLKILSTGKDAARKLILTLPFFDSDFWLQRLSGDLKKDGQVLLQLAALWEEPSWAGQRREIEQRLSPEQLRAIKVLRTKLGYVNPWQGGVLED